YSDLVYGAEHDRQKLDLAVPANANGPAPLVIWIHGGGAGWDGGTKDVRTPVAEAVNVHLLSNGFAIAAVNYRLARDAVFPAQAQDCQRAVRWLREHASD